MCPSGSTEPLQCPFGFPLSLGVDTDLELSGGDACPVPDVVVDRQRLAVVSFCRLVVVPFSRDGSEAVETVRLTGTVTHLAEACQTFLVPVASPFVLAETPCHLPEFPEDRRVDGSVARGHRPRPSVVVPRVLEFLSLHRVVAASRVVRHTDRPRVDSGRCRALPSPLGLVELVVGVARRPEHPTPGERRRHHGPCAAHLRQFDPRGHRGAVQRLQLRLSFPDSEQTRGELACRLRRLTLDTPQQFGVLPECLADPVTEIAVVEQRQQVVHHRLELVGRGRLSLQVVAQIHPRPQRVVGVERVVATLEQQRPTEPTTQLQDRLAFRGVVCECEQQFGPNGHLGGVHHVHRERDPSQQRRLAFGVGEPFPTLRLVVDRLEGPTDVCHERGLVVVSPRPVTGGNLVGEQRHRTDSTAVDLFVDRRLVARDSRGVAGHTPVVRDEPLDLAGVDRWHPNRGQQLPSAGERLTNASRGDTDRRRRLVGVPPPGPGVEQELDVRIVGVRLDHVEHRHGVVSDGLLDGDQHRAVRPCSLDRVTQFSRVEATPDPPAGAVQHRPVVRLSLPRRHRGTGRGGLARPRGAEQHRAATTVERVQQLLAEPTAAPVGEWSFPL